MVINLLYMAMVFKPGLLASPRFTMWYNARDLRTFMGVPRLDEIALIIKDFEMKS